MYYYYYYYYYIIRTIFPDKLWFPSTEDFNRSLTALTQNVRREKDKI